jgi:glutamate synthase domain-containing protein 3
MTQISIKEHTDEVANLDTTGILTRDLNSRLRELTSHGRKQIRLRNVCGQRYIGTDLDNAVELEIYGTPGNDLGAFMDGPRITVYGNAQDGCGNTMNNGEIIIHGRAGDITGLSARGGEIFVRESVGYRAGIHMKEYKEKKPVLIVGGTAQDFLGEYMAGGILIVLGLNLADGEKHQANYIGTGMHGGVIYLKGNINEHQLGKEVGVAELDDHDIAQLTTYVNEFSHHFGYDAEEILRHRYIKLFPLYLRPYGRLYAY